MVDEKYDDFRDLEVWQRCKEIRKQIWALCKKFPKDEKYRLSDQMIRASRSSTACIAADFGDVLEFVELFFCIFRDD
jgi:hypothetical protein